MADVIESGMEFNIEIGAGLDMRNLKESLEGIAGVFRDSASAQKILVDAAAINMKEGAESLKDAGKSIEKSIINGAKALSKEYSSLFNKMEDLFSKPIASLKSMFSESIKGFGSGLVSAGTGAVAAGGAGAAGGVGGAAALLGPEILIVIALLVAVVIILEFIMGFVQKMLDSFMSPILEVLNGISTILLLPMKMIGVVFAEMLIPYLGMAMKFIQVLMPFVMQFQTSLKEIYDNLIEEGSNPVEAMMGATMGAATGVFVEMFKPLYTGMRDIMKGAILGLARVIFMLPGMGLLLQSAGLDIESALGLVSDAFDEAVDPFDTFKQNAIDAGTELGKLIGGFAALGHVIGIADGVIDGGVIDGGVIDSGSPPGDYKANTTELGKNTNAIIGLTNALGIENITGPPGGEYFDEQGQGYSSAYPGGDKTRKALPKKQGTLSEDFPMFFQSPFEALADGFGGGMGGGGGFGARGMSFSGSSGNFPKQNLPFSIDSKTDISGEIIITGSDTFAEQLAQKIAELTDRQGLPQKDMLGIFAVRNVATGSGFKN